MSTIEGIKMCILVHPSIPEPMTPQAALYATLGTFKKFQDTPEVQEWLNKGAEEIIARVDALEFQKAKELREFASVQVGAEEDKTEAAIGFLPCSPDTPQGMEIFKIFERTPAMLAKNPIIYMKDIWLQANSGDKRDNNVIVGVSLGRAVEKVLQLMHAPGASELFETVFSMPFQQWYEVSWREWFMKTAELVQRIGNQPQKPDGNIIIP